ncbi:MAG: hypothetical protein QNJ09_18170 [Paracoccaceae bacterium]|nr:hypothetical protein [Paracoccaceae bacterium]
MSHITRLVALVCLLALGGTHAEAASETEQRRCLFELAIFPSTNTEETNLVVTIAARNRAGQVKVHGSGSWQAKRKKHPSGADTIRFDTGAARETITISVVGEALWEIDYRSKSDADKRVMAYVGECKPWRPQ